MSQAPRAKYLYRKTTKGNDYLYFRMTDGVLRPLPINEHSTAFCEAYDAALAERLGVKLDPATPRGKLAAKPGQPDFELFVGDLQHVILGQYVTALSGWVRLSARSRA